MNISLIDNLSHGHLFTDSSIDTSLLQAGTYIIAALADDGYGASTTPVNLTATVNGIKDGVSGDYAINLTTYSNLLRVAMTVTADGSVRIGSNTFTDINTITISETSLVDVTGYNDLTTSIDNTGAERISWQSSFKQGIPSEIIFRTRTGDTADVTRSSTISGSSGTVTAFTTIKDGAKEIIVSFRCTPAQATAGAEASLSIEVSRRIAVSDNLVNASIDNLVFQNTVLNTYTVTPTAGYSFETAPYISIDGVNITFTESGGVWTLSVDGTLYADASTVSVNGRAILTGTVMTVNLVNGTINTTAFSFITSNSYTVTPTAGYSFETAPYIEIDGVSIPFTGSGGVWSLTVDGTQYQGASSVSVNGSARGFKLIVLPEHFHFYGDSPTGINDTSTNYEFKIQVDSGWTVDGTPKFYAGIQGGVDMTLQDGTYWYVRFNTTRTGYTANEYYQYVLSHDYPYFTAQAVETTVLISDYGVVRAYKTDTAINNSVKNVRFLNVGTGQYNYVDLGQYIVKFVRYPFSVTTKGESTIKLAYYDTQITAPLAEKQIYELSTGVHTISGLYGNSSDIAQCEIDVHLPYYGIVSIEPKYINTDIEIKYRVDILANTAVVMVYSNGVLIDQYDCTVGYDVPYIYKTDVVKSVINFNAGVLKNIVPEIIVRQKPIVPGYLYSNKARVQLDDVRLHGLTICDNVLLEKNVQMTDFEYSEIKRLLTSGVIF